jgi:hypothetical protein
MPRLRRRTVDASSRLAPTFAVLEFGRSRLRRTKCEVLYVPRRGTAPCSDAQQTAPALTLRTRLLLATALRRRLSRLLLALLHPLGLRSGFHIFVLLCADTAPRGVLGALEDELKGLARNGSGMTTAHVGKVSGLVGATGNEMRW